MNFYQLKEEISNLLKKANLPNDNFQVVPGPIHSEGLFYEARGTTYIYGYFERGTVTIFCKTEDKKEFVYYILRDIIKNYAIDYELKLWYQDTRRIWMEKSLEWMKKIDYSYYERLKEEYKIVLKYSGFNDAEAIKLNAIEEYKKLAKQIEHSSVNIKNKKELKADIKKLVSLFNSIRHGTEERWELFKTATFQFLDFYRKIHDREIKLPSEVEAEWKFALEKSIQVINSCDNGANSMNKESGRQH